MTKKQTVEELIEVLNEEEVMKKFSEIVKKHFAKNPLTKTHEK